MTAATSLRWITRDVSRGGGIIGIQNNLLNKEWEDICQEKYTPYALTKETKIHGDMSAGEAPSTGGRVIWIQVTGGVHAWRKARLALTLVGIREC